MNTAATRPAARSNESGWYEIRLQGRLDPRWSASFEAMSLTTGEGFTLLRGPVVDQAALHGLLHQLRDIGVPLTSVTRVEPDDATPPPHHRDTPNTHAQEPDMTLTAPSAPVATSGAPADPTRNHARAAGIFYLLTFLSSIPALLLIGPVLHDAGYVTGAGQDTRVIWGCVLDVVNALTAIGSAVALFPVLRRRHEAMALGFVTSRLMEAAVVMIGVVSLLAVVTLRQQNAGVGSDPTTLTTVAHALVEVRNWTFLLGPGLMPAFNAILLGTVLYRTRLVPRLIPTVGLIGAPLLLAAAGATLFGLFDQVSSVGGLLTVPIAAWELAVGCWMTFKGFDRSAVTALRPTPDRAGTAG